MVRGDPGYDVEDFTAVAGTPVKQEEGDGFGGETFLVVC